MKNNLKKLSVLAIMSFAFLTSCDSQGDAAEVSSVENSKKNVDELYDSNSTLKRQFGKALMMSLNESKALRDLIKNKSLEMFDNDYDVLYQMIKDEKLENNVTVRESILKNIGDENLLNLIELNNPTLTIFVPELPENTFSAKLWNTETEVPKVAIQLFTSNDVPIINQDGTEEIFGARYTPGFPIIVIKENERVVVARNKEYSKLTTRVLRNDSSVEFKFLDECFDSSKNNKEETSRPTTPGTLDSKIVDAYNMYESADGWQRDYIYYGISPTTTKGPFKYDFQETVKSFTLLGDPTAAFNSISDQTGDPRLPVWVMGNKDAPLTPISHWTGGNFEFKIRILVNGKNGVGSEIIKYFTATVDDLFDYSYVRGVSWNYRYHYDRKISSVKTVNLNIPIFNWDLDQYASTIKIDIEEVDLTETTVLTDTRTVEFATNFGIDAGFGTITKLGLKYGASLKQTTTSTVQRTFTQGNDLLGDVIVNFADKIIIAQPSLGTYQTREYSSGLYSVSIEPTRVQ
ncbi:hypothetical protein [Flavobacterium sp. KMS]|uniref:hypothetical protein n=1 Tax=Flavobacterium sp. KMS TaxID=1566023 RepID=UPI000689C074|nr:hypothetical protein [Flavobacterium sp. KMS]